MEGQSSTSTAELQAVPSDNRNNETGTGNVASLRWMKLHGDTMKAVKFSQSFRTLRDMVGDIYIDDKHLKKVQKIGEGSFAIVEKCIYETDDGKTREVAVKRLKKEIFKSQGDVRDFVNEAKILKKLSHINIVEIIGLGMQLDNIEKTKNTDKENFYIVQEFMTQGTLMSKVTSQMKQSPKVIYTLQQGVQWLIHVAQGLAYLHNANPRVIHRDLKLENVMLQQDYNGNIIAKLGDFGLHALVPSGNMEPRRSDRSIKPSKLSKSLSRQQKRTASIQREYTLSGRTGSILYMAPEVLKSDKYNEKADVFSFGILAYEVLQKCMLLAFIKCINTPNDIERYVQYIINGSRPHMPSKWPAEVKELINMCWKEQSIMRPSMDDVVRRLKVIQEKQLMYENKVPEQEEMPACVCCSMQ